jgi:hypothetical protein
MDNIKIDLREIEWNDMDWIDLAQDKDQWRVLVNTVMNLRVPQNAGKFLSSCTTDNFSRRGSALGASDLCIFNPCTSDVTVLLVC